VAAAIGIVGTFIQARYVGPDDLGYLRQFGIATNYAFFLHLGLWHALQRRYPLYIGQGRQDQAMAVVEICQSWNVAIAIIASGIFTALAAVALMVGNWRAALAWLAQAVAMAGNFYGGYLGATYRSGHDFETAAKSSVIASITGLACLPMFPFWSYPALVLRSSLGSLASLLYLHIRRPLRLPWRFNWREWYYLLKEGLPLFTASYGAGVGWSAVEATLVLHYLGAHSLGLWSACIMMLELAKTIPQTIVAIYVPRLTEQYGRTASIRECLDNCWKPMLLGGAGVTAIAAMLWAGIPFAVTWLTPKYIEAIPTMCLMMLYLPTLIIELPLALLIAMGNLIQQNVATYGGLVCFLIFAIVSVHMGWGVNGVVAASLLGHLFRTALSYGFIFAAIGSNNKQKCSAA
jgi:O-antigen/teichoic acid export membrane protein